MNCERCECTAYGVFLLRFADESRYFRFCMDCLDLYRYAIAGDEVEDDEDFEELEELEEVGDPCEVAFDEIVESAEDPE
jgi:hypothetical protein